MSKIEWTEKTWNPVVGCTPVSSGCLNCYAATMARRLEGMGVAEYQPRRLDRDGRNVTGLPGLQDESDRTVRIAEVKGGRAVFTGDVRTVPDRLPDPLHWRKPALIFVNSMSDLFHESVPFEFIDRVFAVMALCPQHTFQVLTKRPERMAEYLTSMDGRDMMRLGAASAAMDTGRQFDTLAYRWPLPNVWLGTSVENQATADERIPHLLRCPAAVRFLSCEPLLGAVDLGLRSCLMGNRGGLINVDGQIGRLPGIDWVIVGGESGPHARPCDVAWVRSVVGQCRAAGVPCFVKQLGARPYHVEDGEKLAIMLKSRKGGVPEEWEGYPETDGLNVREWPKGVKA